MLHRISSSSSRRKAILIVLAIALIGIPVVVTASWLVTETMIELTSGEEFCTTCHTMKPMAQAYREDLHGGRSSHGTQAKCVDCHLPHDNLLVYLMGKARTGIHDVWAQMFYDLSKIDWEEKRQHRERYVYDSGCLHCHTNLERATMANNKAFVAHRPYFLGETKRKCVSCHSSVGHANLSLFLKKSG